MVFTKPCTLAFKSTRVQRSRYGRIDIMVYIPVRDRQGVFDGANIRHIGHCTDNAVTILCTCTYMWIESSSQWSYLQLCVKSMHQHRVQQ